MKTKEKLLELLNSRRDSFLSGEDLAKELEISRAAVWKAVKTLREEGYAIEAGTNRGYRLEAGADVLSEWGIRRSLGDRDLTLEVYPCVDSTSDLLRQRAAEGAPEGLVIVAGGQTAGRGRMGRSFYSPRDTGVYLSMLLRPRDWTADRALHITTMAAVALCEAIGAVTDARPQIKWVNDIFVNGKKVCGILTEGSFDFESGRLDHAVLGVGMDVYPPKDGYPEDLTGIAGWILKDPVEDGKNRLTAEFIRRFLDLYRSEAPDDYIARYRAYSMVIGKKITVLSPEGRRTARVDDIDDRCRLKVTYENGEKARLSYGEIRILPEK